VAPGIADRQNLAGRLCLAMQPDQHAQTRGVAHDQAGNVDDDGVDDRREFGECFGEPDPALEAVVEHDALCRALPLLPERLRLILTLRYVDELSQSQIADKIGMSQMHVSRLLSRSIVMLRRHMTAEEPTALAA